MYCKWTFVFKDGNPHESGFLEDNGNRDGTQNLGCDWQKIVWLLGNCMILGFLDCIKYSLILTLNQMIATSRIMAMDCLHQQVLPPRKRGWILDSATASYNQTMPNKVKTWRQSPDQTLKRVVFSFGAQEHNFQHQVETINAKRNGVHWKTMSQNWPYEKRCFFQDLSELVRDLTIIFSVRLLKPSFWQKETEWDRTATQVVLKQRNFLVMATPSPGETQGVLPPTHENPDTTTQV